MRNLLVLVLFAFPSFAQPQNAVDEVRNAEIGFAKAFADRDVAKFRSYLAHDTTFFSGRAAFHGPSKVVEAWQGFLQSPEPPFSWGPERVHVSDDGKIGFSTGPVYDARGKLLSYYVSTWRRESDGTWKVLFDGPGIPAVYAGVETPAVEEGFVTTADGVKLHYKKAGRSPLTLIVPLEFVLWEDFRQLTEIATVIAYDLRNRGRSTRSQDAKTWTIQQDVADLETVRAHFKAETFVPVGFSYLGKMVVMYAKQHPQRVSRIIQIGPAEMTSGAYDNARKKLDFAELGAPAADIEALRTAQARGDSDRAPREFCDAQWKVLRYMFVGDPRLVSRVDVSHCTLENEWPKNFNRHVLSILESMKSAPLTAADLSAVKVPVLTIHGTDDRNATYAGGREWAQSLPDARLLTVKEAAHMPWLDDPVNVFGAIRMFLRGEWPHAAERVAK